MDKETVNTSLKSVRIIDIITKKGIHFRHYEHRSPDFSKVEKPANVNGFVLDENNNVLLVEMNGEFWGPPGGKIEQGETPDQALAREVDEESGVEIDTSTVMPFFYTDTYIEEPVGTMKYLGARLRYICRVKNKKEFTGDPDGEITNIFYCPIDDLPKYLNWGDTLPIIMGVLKGYVKDISPAKILK